MELKPGVIGRDYRESKRPVVEPNWNRRLMRKEAE